MAVFNYALTAAATAGLDILNLSDEVAELVSQSGIGQGVCVVFVPGSTGGLTTIEYESGALADLSEAIERIAPRDMAYQHDARWGDGNGYAHVRAALLGPSLSVPIVDGRMTLGTWQQIVLLDFDNRPRTRRIVVQVVGEVAV